MSATRRLAILTAALASLNCSPRHGDRPNVILIVIDTLRADHLGSYGYARPTSPRLDALAAGGARFAQAHSTSSWTAPGVASILTGDYAPRHGVELPSSQLSPQTGTLAEAFRAAGYQTAAYSANPAFVSPRQGFDRGFDQFIVLHSGPAGSDLNADIVPGASSPDGEIKVAVASQVTAAVVDWFGRHEAQKPFFLYVHYFDPHSGYFPPAEFAQRFGVAAGSPMLTAEQRRSWKTNPGPDDLATLKSLYDGEIAFTDAELGRLLDAAPKSRPALIVVTADHGEEFLDHGGMMHGRTLYEEMLRVPLIFSGPGVKPGAVLERVVTVADIAPTLAELVGLPPLQGIDGVSMATSLRSGREPQTRPVFADESKSGKTSPALHRRAVVDGPLKLLQNMNEGFGLFDLGKDPAEQNDLFAPTDPRAAALQSILARRDADERGAGPPAPTLALSDEDKDRMRALGYEPE